jgi:hypothetical protein
MSFGSRHECTAWTYCARADWRGPTYSYSTVCRAWDEGRKERGDESGLIVKIKGQLCVLQSVATIYDDNVPRDHHQSRSAATDEQDEDELPEFNTDAEDAIESELETC